MKNGSFKTIKAIIAAALLISAAAIALTCFLPGILINRLYGECVDDLDKAVAAALEERNDIAYLHIQTVCGRLEKSKKLLMVFYDHNKVIELTGSAGTALELAKTKDTAQLITELCGIEKAFDYLIHTNDAGLYNVF